MQPKCRYHCDYGDGEYCHYTGEGGCVMNANPKENKDSPVRFTAEQVRDEIRELLRNAWETNARALIGVECSVLMWAEYWLDKLVKDEEESGVSYPAKIDCVTCPYKEECDERFDAALAGKIATWSCKQNGNDPGGDNDVDRMIHDLYHIADCLGVYKRYAALPDCNNCGAKDRCKYVPGPGENTRINCPHWVTE